MDLDGVLKILTFLVYQPTVLGYRVSCSYDIPNGRIKWCSGRHCKYECDDDYIATREWLYCEQGYWTDSDGLTGHIYDTDRITKLDKNTFCRAKRCPDRIPNGALSSTCSPVVGSRCEYSCNPGYEKKADTTTIRCQTSSEWNVSPHTLCTNNNQCPNMEIVNGVLDMSCRRQPGEACTFTCRLGYKQRHNYPTLHCHQSLTWSQSLGYVCKSRECPKTIPNGYVPTYRCKKGYNAYCIHYFCNTGYYRPFRAPALRCNAQEQWEWDTSQGEPCIRSPSATTARPNLCPNTIPNGQISADCDRQINSYCRYTCASGCEASEQTVHCYDYHNWVEWTPRLSACICLTTDISPIPSRTRHSSWKVVGPILGVALMILILVALGVRNYKRQSTTMFNEVTTLTVTSRQAVPMHSTAAHYHSPYTSSPRSRSQWDPLFGHTERQQPQTRNTLDAHSYGPLVREPAREANPYVEPPPSYDQVISNPTQFKS